MESIESLIEKLGPGWNIWHTAMNEVAVQIVRPDSGSHDPKASRHTISAPTLREALQQAAGWTWPIVLQRRPQSICADDWMPHKVGTASWILRHVSDGRDYGAQWATKRDAIRFIGRAEQASQRMQAEWDAHPDTKITRTGVEGVDFIYQY